MQLGLAPNGVNPFAKKCSTWSTWPILLMNYNIPPWLTNKKLFIMLSFIIPNPRCVTNAQFDTYLEPSMEELKLLWEVGVHARNATAFNG